jgi:GTP-binding protein
VHCLLSKADKLSRMEAAGALRLAQTILASYVDENGVAFPYTAQLFSALKRTGLEEADARIRELLSLTNIDEADMVRE